MTENPLLPRTPKQLLCLLDQCPSTFWHHRDQILEDNFSMDGDGLGGGGSANNVNNGGVQQMKLC